jgi:hypothetical protein
MGFELKPTHAKHQASALPLAGSDLISGCKWVTARPMNLGWPPGWPWPQECGFLGFGIYNSYRCLGRHLYLALEHRIPQFRRNPMTLEAGQGRKLLVSYSTRTGHAGHILLDCCNELELNAISHIYRGLVDSKTCS